MKTFVHCSVIAIALVGCQADPTNQPPEAVSGDAVWLTIGSDAVDTVRETFADRDPSFQVEVSKGGVATVRIDESLLAELSAVMHNEFRRCGGFLVHDSEADAKAMRDRDLTATRRKVIAYTIDNPGVAQRMIEDIDAGHILETVSSLSGFRNRFHANPTGAEAARWLADVWSAYAQGRTDVQVELVQHPNTPQPSVMLTIAGTTTPDEVVVLGGHLDSIAGSSGPNMLAPGADDDASGVASVSEVVRVALANGFRPERTVKVFAYAAEEVGLRGSNNIASQFAAQNIDVVGVLQLDMTNYSGSGTDIFLIQDFTNNTQNLFVESLIDAYLPGISRGRASCGYACSDHASWTAAGFPASFPFESSFSTYNPFIHTSGDTIANSGGDATHAAKFSRLASAYLAEMAKGTLAADTSDDDPPTGPPTP